MAPNSSEAVIGIVATSLTAVHMATQDFASPHELMAELVALAMNRTAYERYMAWKRKPFKQLSPGFLAFTQNAHLHLLQPRCQVSKQRAVPM